LRGRWLQNVLSRSVAPHACTTVFGLIDASCYSFADEDKVSRCEGNSWAKKLGSAAATGGVWLTDMATL
jgi:hypothetical protein